MSGERASLVSQPVPSRRPPYGSPDDNQQPSVDEDDRYVRLHRRTAYCLVGYALLASILALALLLALLLSGTGTGTDGADRRQRPWGSAPPPPPAMPTDPSSPALHSPRAARRSWNKTRLGHFLLLTDIHLEPHYDAGAFDSQLGVCRPAERLSGCWPTDWESVNSSASGSFAYGRYMCDPPLSLVSTSLRSLAVSLAALPLDVVLLTGDMAAHFIACPRTLHSTINHTLSLVAAAFPSTPLVFSIGNTDLFPTNSLSPPPLDSADFSTVRSTGPRAGCDTAFSALLGLLLLHGVLDERADDDSIATFCRGGYYSARVNAGRIRILSLNTIAWSQQLLETPPPNHSQLPSNLAPASRPVACEARQDDPFGQFEWLEAEVRLAAEHGQHVWLVGHIPPGIKAGEEGWCWRYWQRLQRLLRQHESVITQLQFGDYSQDMIRLVQHSSGGVSHVVHINPGLSPRKNVNPAARVYTYNRSSSAVVDYQQLYIDLTRSHTAPRTEPPQPPAWLFQYSALAAYGLGEYSAAGWLEALRRMRWSSGDNGVALERYVRGVNVWKAGEGNGLDYLCDAMVMELEENRRCKQTGEVEGLEEARGQQRSEL